MADLGRKMYVKGQSWFNSMKNDEEGSTAVEFMGIAAVAVVIVLLVSKMFEDEGSTGGGLITTLLDTAFGAITKWFK